MSFRDHSVMKGGRGGQLPGEYTGQPPNARILCFQNNKRMSLIQILYGWHNRKIISMVELVQRMVIWNREGCLDPEVWEKFLRHALAPSLMPAPSELQLPTSPERSFKKFRTEETVNKKLNKNVF